MKKLLIFIFLLAFSQGHSNNRQIYKYYFYLTNSYLAPEFSNSNGLMVYEGSDSETKAFFSNYEILKFERAITAVEWESLRRVFIIETYDEKLAVDLIKEFPNVYEKFEEFTYGEIELATFPNDYGTTNPNSGQNTGASVDRRELDYINVPKAWDITDGLPNNDLKIGISDAKINILTSDFSGKTTFINPGAYQNSTYNPSNSGIETWHGTAVAGIAAAQGDNGFASTGVCKDCKIVSTAYGNYNNLLLLAQDGVKVINMSWTFGSPFEFEQTVIDSLTTHYKVVCVAAAGNVNSFDTAEDFHCNNSYWNGTQRVPILSLLGVRTYYPASYNNVISVSGIEHKNPMTLPLTSSNPGFVGNNGSYDVFVNIRDSFSQQVGNLEVNNPLSLIYDDWAQYCLEGNGQYSLVSPNGIVSNYTVNEHVDILAPTTGTFRYDKFIETGVISYDGGGTSGAAPIVTGTVALMLITNSCLIPADVDSVLKLTANNVEALPINRDYGQLGWLGAGKVETGDAVEFVNEMKKTDGNALIDGHDFKRFTFDLQNINNKLTISNQTFREQNISNFIAKNEIRILPGTSIKPNANGSFHLGINPNINVSCSPSNRIANSNVKDTNSKKFKKETILYPNPNNGNFNLENVDFELFYSDKVNVTIVDLNGRILFEDIITKSEINSYSFSFDNKFSSGIYMLNLNTESYNKSIKFIVK